MISKLFPLDFFYRRAGLKLPEHCFIAGEKMPEPYRGLLVHERDMTGALQEFHRSRLHLKLISLSNDGKRVYREVALIREDSRPVEFGAIKIDLTLFPPKARAEIEKGYVPLGAILSQLSISCISRPHLFFVIDSDTFINQALDLDGAQRLYGRVNTLFSPEKKVLAKVVEILPPV